ncbi:MAG: hypothetical protein KC445_02920 [Anaerolineales bacterium]|nr:hypothetical protein [Anaerolineales bacterium]
MSNSGERRFSGFGLYVLWTLVLILFYVLVGAVFSVPTVREQGVPLWLIIGRLLVLSGLTGGLVGVLTGQTWGIWLFFASAMVMIPMSVTYTYYFLLFSEAGFELTAGWVVGSTVRTAVFVMVIVAVVLWSVRPKRGN